MARDRKYQEKKQSLVKKYGLLCSYCDREFLYEELRLDHIMPKSRGGSNHIKNYVLSCERCNASKWAQTLEEWLEKNIMYRDRAYAEYEYRNNIVNNLKKVLYGKSSA